MGGGGGKTIKKKYHHYGFFKLFLSGVTPLHKFDQIKSYRFKRNQISQNYGKNVQF